MATAYTITMPLSADELGRWLETNNVELSISCALANYCVKLEWGRLISYTDCHYEKRTLTRYNKDLTVALSEAVETAKQLMAKGWSK